MFKCYIEHTESFGVKNLTTATEIPETFLDQVKEVLENLYDFPFLNRHLLAASTSAGLPTEPAGHRLRREIVDAIESLNPGAGAGARSNTARIYNLLHMHYVGGMTLQEAANDLGISVRQAYRDLRQGNESVGYVLWYNRDSAPAARGVEAGESMDDARTVTNVHAILEAAVKAVQRLAEQSGVRLRVKVPTEPIIISTDQAAAQQIFIHLLSQTIQAADEGEVAVELTAVQEDVQLELHYPSHAQGTEEAPVVVPITEVIQKFIEQLHFRVTQGAYESGGRWLRLLLSARRPTLLIIDDHQGLIDLLQHYVTGQSIKVLSASDGVSGLRLAEEIQPNAIIVDLMMPGMDGWELLQRLRTIPRTENIPVIICSVINDPELAYSLGASLFLSKPVTRDSLLTALQLIGV